MPNAKPLPHPHPRWLSLCPLVSCFAPPGVGQIRAGRGGEHAVMRGEEGSPTSWGPSDPGGQSCKGAQPRNALEEDAGFQGRGCTITVGGGTAPRLCVCLQRQTELTFLVPNFWAGAECKRGFCSKGSRKCVECTGVQAAPSPLALLCLCTYFNPPADSDDQKTSSKAKLLNFEMVPAEHQTEHGAALMGGQETGLAE